MVRATLEKNSLKYSLHRLRGEFFPEADHLQGISKQKKYILNSQTLNLIYHLLESHAVLLQSPLCETSLLFHIVQECSCMPPQQIAEPEPKFHQTKMRLSILNNEDPGKTTAGQVNSVKLYKELPLIYCLH